MPVAPVVGVDAVPVVAEDEHLAVLLMTLLLVSGLDDPRHAASEGTGASAASPDRASSRATSSRGVSSERDALASVILLIGLADEPGKGPSTHRSGLGRDVPGQRLPGEGQKQPTVAVLEDATLVPTRTVLEHIANLASSSTNGADRSAAVVRELARDR
jgi:hypothetical protein